MFKLLAYTTKEPRLKLIIEEDFVEVGFYLYVFPIDSKKSIADFLQNSLEDTLEFAKSNYGIEKDEWKKVKSDPIYPKDVPHN
ncbi:MAG: hypothetical protein AB1414_20680 [bacterium]